MLVNQAPFLTLAPPADEFELTFENDVFRVYARR